MPASKAEQVLDALKALLETVPGAAVTGTRDAAAGSRPSCAGR